MVVEIHAYLHECSMKRYDMASSYMSYMSFKGHIWAGDILTSTDNITIAWDATSIDG